MKRLVVAAMFLAACTPAQQKHRGAVVIDVSPLRQAQAQSGAGRLDSVGLLIVRGQLATLEEETSKLDNNAAIAEEETVTPPATAPDVIVETAPSAPLPARGLEMVDVAGSLAAPRLSDAAAQEQVSAQDVPPVSYYPVTLEEGSDRFSIELPAGRAQNMYLIGYAVPEPGRKPLPTYVAAALGVTLNPQEDTEVVFKAYPAGLAIPQFLPPTLTGLRDAAGNPVTSLPDMSCLAVAQSNAPRSDFPAVSLSRVNVGSVASQLQNAGVAGLFVLPTGRYRLDCFAAFAGKLFGVDPNRPLEVEIAQGKVALPTAGLVKLRDLPVSGPTTMPDGTVTLPDSGLPLPDGMNAMPMQQRYRISLATSTVAARQTAVGNEPALGGDQVNFTTDFRGALTIQAYNADGTFNYASNDLVQVSMRPAYNPTRWGTEAGGDTWLPLFDGTRATKTFDVQLIDGTAFVQDAVRFDALVAETQTYQYIVMVRPYDVNQVALRPAGARYVTVTGVDVCSNAQPNHVEMFTLTEENNTLTLNARSDNSYDGLWENTLLVAASPAPARCAKQISAPGNGLQLIFEPLLGADLRLQFSPAFVRTGSQYAVTLPPLSDSQGVMWDAVRPSAGAAVGSPAPGTVLPDLDVKTYLPVMPETSLSHWLLRIAVRSAP